MKKRIKVYLDTSVISALFDYRNPERQSLTEKFFNEIVNTMNNLKKIEIITPAEIL